MSYRLRTIEDIMRLRYDGVASGASEAVALLALLDDGPCMMTKLGSMIPLSRAAVTTLTDRLEATQIIRRTPDPGDRRRIILELTKKGSARIERALNTPLTEA